MPASHATASVTGSVRVLFEDVDLLAVNKPANLVAHPAYRHPDGTLYDLVSQLLLARGEPPAWLLHRLDRDTSGVVLFAKTERARRHVVRQFERREVGKGYLALVAGDFGGDQRQVSQPLRRDPADRRRVIVEPTGQAAITQFFALARSSERSLIFCRPVTGRTHQIRAHLAWLGHPIVGDATYTPPADPTEHPAGGAEAATAGRHLLHALALRVRHPASGDPLEVWAPLPEDLRSALPDGWINRCKRPHLVAAGAWDAC